MDALPVELQPDETVVARYRRTPVFFYAKLIGIALAALSVVVLLWVLNATVGLSGIWRTVGLAAGAIWLLLWLGAAYLAWYRHVHDEWIITTQRLIDSYKRNWFNQTVASADLVNVQDLSVSRTGLLQSIFNFGDVVCQTAGTNSRFVLSDVPRPADVLRTIDGTRDTARGLSYEPHRRPPPDLTAGTAQARSAGIAPQFVPGAAPRADDLPPTPRP